MTAVRIGEAPIDPSQLLADVAAAANGAAVLFVGTVRDHADGRSVEGLEYTAYEAMARDELARIVGEAEHRFPGTTFSVAHRLGALAPGDVSVAVAAAHAHRAPAFEAARFVIEELKARVPIWKREQFADGTREWVAAHAPAVVP
jgi:molybdopterin synthase catalytic subunit